MNAPFSPEKPPEPLKVEAAAHHVWADGQGEHHSLALTLNRAPSENEIEAYRSFPATPHMAEDCRQFASRLLVAELVCRLFEFYILGSIVLPDTPAAMDWLKSYLKGDGHGPVGHPLRWPVFIPSAVMLLARWGYEPRDGFVAKAH